MEPTSSQTSASDTFRMTFWVSDTQDYAAQPVPVSNGTIQQLTNGVNAWQENEANSIAVNPGSNVCPKFQIINQAKSHFSYQLKNGKYLSGYGSYCEGQKDTVNLTYQQQLTSQPWQNAIKIIASINFQ